MGKKITAHMFAHFHGDDHMNVNELTELILELVNEKYPIKSLRADICGIWDEPQKEDRDNG